MMNCWMCVKCDTTEYVDTGLATERGDIYSFGVMILELVTGRRPCDDFFQESGMSLPQWVRKSINYLSRAGGISASVDVAIEQ